MSMTHQPHGLAQVARPAASVARRSAILRWFAERTTTVSHPPIWYIARSGFWKLSLSIP